MSKAKKTDNAFLSPHVPIRHPATVCTRDGFVFFRRHRMVFDFFLLGTQLAHRADENRLRAARALAFNDEGEYAAQLEVVEADKSATFDYLAGFSEYQSEILCIRLVDNFQCFLSDITQSCMRKQPNLLRSSETITLEELLDFRRFGELTKHLIDRKLHALSYSGVESVISYLSKNVGINIAMSNDELTRLKVAVELRNIYTHNRGRVDRTFIKKIGSAGAKWQKFELDRRFHADFDVIVAIGAILDTIAHRIDAAAGPKFGLSRKRIATWLKDEPPRRKGVIAIDI
jgi:hypothetical protein